jgi:hypothetical protein
VKVLLFNHLSHSIYFYGLQHLTTHSLKSGPKVDVFVGSVGDQFIGIEGAYKNVLCQFSGLAKTKLSPYGVTRFNIPNTSKTIINWIYRFMLAGEKNPANDKFEDFDIPDLILVYSHADILEYKFLMDKTSKRLQYIIANVELLDVETMKSLTTSVPPLRNILANSLAYKVCEWVIPFDWTPIYEVHTLKCMGDILDAAIQDRLNSWIARSKRYYDQPHMKDKLRFSNNHYYGTAAIARPPRKIQGQKNQISFANFQANVPPEEENMLKDGRGRRRKPTRGSISQDKVSQKPTTNDDLTPATKTYTARSKRNAAKSSNKSNSHSNVDTKFVDQTPLSKKQPAMGKRLANLNCYNCGERGHLSRDCVLQLPEHEQIRANHTIREPIICYSCNEAGHIARDCGYPSCKPVRQPPICYNCNCVGHIARNCPEPRISCGAQDSTESINIDHNKKNTCDSSNSRASVYAGRNRNRRRANAERYADKYFEKMIDISGNGETITTCDREVKQGQVTRLGLTI